MNVRNNISDNYIKACQLILNGIKSYYTETLKTDLTADNFIEIVSNEIYNKKQITDISDTYKLSCRHIFDSIKTHISTDLNVDIQDNQMSDILKEIYCTETNK